jgi:hypothetical protein
MAGLAGPFGIGLLSGDSPAGNCVIDDRVSTYASIRISANPLFIFG